MAKTKVEWYIINAWLILKWWVTLNKDYIIEKELSVPFKDSWDFKGSVLASSKGIWEVVSLSVIGIPRGTWGR